MDRVIGLCGTWVEQKDIEELKHVVSQENNVEFLKSSPPTRYTEFPEVATANLIRNCQMAQELVIASKSDIVVFSNILKEWDDLMRHHSTQIRKRTPVFISWTPESYRSYIDLDFDELSGIQPGIMSLCCPIETLAQYINYIFCF